jgi:hypothetical protein
MRRMPPRAGFGTSQAVLLDGPRGEDMFGVTTRRAISVLSAQVSNGFWQLSTVTLRPFTGWLRGTILCTSSIGLFRQALAISHEGLPAYVVLGWVYPAGRLRPPTGEDPTASAWTKPMAATVHCERGREWSRSPACETKLVAEGHAERPQGTAPPLGPLPGLHAGEAPLTAA